MHSTAEGGSDETSTEIHAINPSDLSLTRDPRMERESFGFPLGFTPRHYWQRMPRREQVSRTLTRDYTFDINRTSNSASTHNLRLRVAPPSLSRGRWCAPGRRLPSGRHPPLFHGQSLRPRWNIPSAGGTFTRRQREFTLFTHHPRPGWLPAQGREPRLQAPAGLLLACGPRMEHGPLRLLPRAPHPAVTRDARQGGDRPSRTGPGTTPPASAGPPAVPPT